jgi:hypothetical protein
VVDDIGRQSPKILGTIMDSVSLARFAARGGVAEISGLARMDKATAQRCP